MKTYYFSTKNCTVFSLNFAIALLLTSCASYQNKNYDENDGIYANSDRRDSKTTSEDKAYYKGYFNSLQDNSEVITDIENYNSQIDSTQNDTIYYASRNAGWGSSSENVTVNIIDNGWGYSPFWYSGYGWGGWYGPGWGWNLGWGWNSWYGGGWGWGNPYWNNYGWGGYYPYHYHYGNGPRYSGNYGVSSGRRGALYSGGRYASSGRRTDATFRNSTNRNSYTVRNGSGNNPTRFTTRNAGTRNSSYTPTRNTTRNNSYTTPTRNNSYTPTRSTAPTRSYTPSSSGGGRSGGGASGGGRSGGGGGRRG